MKTIKLLLIIAVFLGGSSALGYVGYNKYQAYQKEVRELKQFKQDEIAKQEKVQEPQTQEEKTKEDIKQLYIANLSREPSETEISDWVSKNVSISEIETAIKQSSEYKNKHPLGIAIPTPTIPKTTTTAPPQTTTPTTQAPTTTQPTTPNPAPTPAPTPTPTQPKIDTAFISNIDAGIKYANEIIDFLNKMISGDWGWDSENFFRSYGDKTTANMIAQYRNTAYENIKTLNAYIIELNQLKSNAQQGNNNYTRRQEIQVKLQSIYQNLVTDMERFNDYLINNPI